MARSLLGWWIGWLACCAIGHAAPAHAEPVERRSAAELYAAGSAAFGELRYREAVGLLERAWHRGDSQPAQLRAIFALAGRAAASMGREGAAQLWFQRWLCIEPGAELPAGASPKLQAAMARAREALAGAALAVRAERRGAAVELTIRDPLALAASVRADGARTQVAGARVTLAGARGEVELLDLYGNVLMASAVEPAAPAITPPPATDPRAPRAAPRDAPWYDGWPPWAIAAGAFATLGVAAWWIADDADDQARNSGDEEEEADLRRRRDLATWVSRGALVAMGVAVVGGVVVYARGRDRVVVVPQPGGAAIAWRLRF
jgi:hypothetical protein